MKNLLLLGLAVLTFSACAGTVQRDFLAEEYRTEVVRLPYSMSRFKIADKRVATPGLEGVVETPLPGADESLIKSELAQYFSAGKPGAAADVELLEGHEQIANLFSGRKVTVKTRIRVTLADAGSGSGLVHATGESSLEFQSNGLSDEFAKQVYDRALKIAVFQAAQALKSGSSGPSAAP